MSKSVLLVIGVLTLCYLGTVSVVEASSVVFPTPENVGDYQVVASPAADQVFYGTLDEFPHTYVLVVDADEAPMEFSAQLFLPYQADAAHDHSLLLVREGNRGVQEITRHNGRKVEWNSFFDRISGDRYATSERYEGALETGVYLLEVSTPTNDGPYALVLGEYSPRPVHRYFKSLGEIRDIKNWYGKSSLSMFQSALVWFPLLLLLIYLAYRWYAKDDA